MSAPNRELTISYGAYTIGGSTGIHPVESFDYGKEPLDAWVEFEFLVVGSGINDAAATADFLAKCAAADAAFRVPRATLTVIMNGMHLSFSPGSNTGFNHQPKLSTPHGEAQTGLTRLYRVRMDVELPADTFGQSGRADSAVNLNTPLNQRRALQVSGEYRALGGNDARSQYNAAIGAYESSLESGFSGTWVKLDEDANADDTTKKLQFRRSYREVYSTYLLEAQISLSYGEPNRRRLLTVTGSYLSSNPGVTSSRSIYNAQIAGFQGTITTAFGGIWYLAPETATTEDNDARCDFKRTLYECYSGYLLRSQIGLSWTPERLRRLVVQVTYVAGGSNGAIENYNANASVYAAAAYTALGGTWKLVGEDSPKDDNDQRVDGALVYEEQNTGGTLGPLLHAAVPRQDISLRVAQPAPGDSPQGGAVRLKECSAIFNCSVDRTQVNDYKTFYESVVRPYVIAQLGAASGAGSVTVVNEEPNYRPDSPNVGCTIAAVVAGASVLEYEQVTLRDVDPGNEIDELWTGDQYDAYVWPGHVVDVITIAIKRRAIAGAPALDVAGTKPNLDGRDWILQPLGRSSVQRQLGQAAVGAQINVVDETLTVRWRGVNAKKGGKGSLPSTTGDPGGSSGAQSFGPGGNNTSPSPILAT